MSATPTGLVLQALLHAADATGVPFAIVSGVAKQESGYNPQSVGTKGEQGLMQLMPATRASMGVRDGFDPVANALAGAKLLARLYRKYGDWYKTFAAYNWGEGHVDRTPIGSSWPEQVQRYAANVAAMSGLPPPPFGLTIAVEFHDATPAAIATLERWRSRGLLSGF